jgi:hypothetical protein
VIIIIEKFQQLMSNINEIKANRCYIEESTQNIYDALSNHSSIGSYPILFDGNTLPVSGTDLVISDNTLNISIVASYNSANEYIKIIGLETDVINIYADTVWNTTLEYTLPLNFVYDTVTGLDAQKALAESIILTIPKHEQTICDLATRLYGGSGSNQGFSNLWIDSNTGSDYNDGYTKTTAFQTLEKTLEVLNSTNTGDHVITVHLATGNYTANNIINSFNKIEFIGEIHNIGDEVNINTDGPLKIVNSDNLVFRELRFTNNTDNISYEGLCLVLQNCDNFEISQCNFYHKGAAYALDNVGLLSLLNSNGLVANTEFSYDNVQTNPGTGAGAVRVSNNSFFSWNNWNVTSNNLQYLILCNEGWAYFNREIPTNNSAKPNVPKNTIGWYNNSIQSSNKTVEEIEFGAEPDPAESMLNPQKLYLWGEE